MADWSIRAAVMMAAVLLLSPTPALAETGSEASAQLTASRPALSTRQQPAPSPEITPPPPPRSARALPTRASVRARIQSLEPITWLSRWGEVEQRPVD
jgi:hypothetical protein